MGHVAPLGSGTRRLSPRTTFAYDSMVESSSPDKAVASGAGSTGATAFSGFLVCLLSRIIMKHDMQIEQKNAGITTESTMILKISRPRDLSVD